MVLLEERDDAGGLGVKGAGDEFDGMFDDLLDAGFRDGDLVGEGVDGAAVFGGLEEGVGVDLGGCHCGGCGEGSTRAEWCDWGCGGDERC